jgi:hypothetical protein
MECGRGPPLSVLQAKRGIACMCKSRIKTRRSMETVEKQIIKLQYY